MGEVGYKTLAIDIETFSDVDLIKCGVYAYADSPAFEILLFAYSFDDEETKIIDLAQGEQLTEEIKNALSDVGIIKTAFNANFERTCLSKYMGVRLSPESWVCTAVQSAMLALPLSLEGVGAVLGLSEQKLKEGKDLIRYFCVPCKPTKTNGGRSRNLPCHAPEKWEQFKTYCIRDVDVEKGIRQKLHKFPIPESEMAFYRLDQEINDRGVLVDRELVEQSITCDLLHKDIVTNRAYEVTGLENPNSVSQLKGWLSERGVEIDSLSKGAVAELIEDADGEVLEASASAMFGVPIEEITKGSPLRQKGKIAELALGYGGAVGALTSMGALAMGLSEEELPGLVSTWRNANPHITQFWWDVDEAAVRAVRERKETQVGLIRFQYASGILFAMLPSGRKLAYVKPRMGVNKYGRDGLTYEGVGENKKWERMDTYGPKLVENIVQGTSRDILAEAMMRLKKAGFSIVFHVHDEAVLEVPEGESSVEEVCRIMAEQPSWVHGLPLRADGYECQFYKKD